MPSLLQEWCDANDCTITEVADLSGYSVAYLSLISRGLRTPPPHVKTAIARALGTRVKNLFPADRQAAST